MSAQLFVRRLLHRAERHEARVRDEDVGQATVATCCLDRDLRRGLRDIEVERLEVLARQRLDGCDVASRRDDELAAIGGSERNCLSETALRS